MTVIRFNEVCTRRGLKVNADKSKVMVLNEGKGLECEVHVDGIRLENSRNLNIWDVFLTNQAQMGAKCSRKVAGAIRYLVNAKDL